MRGKVRHGKVRHGKVPRSYIITPLVFVGFCAMLLSRVVGMVDEHVLLLLFCHDVCLSRLPQLISRVSRV